MQPGGLRGSLMPQNPGLKLWPRFCMVLPDQREDLFVGIAISGNFIPLQIKPSSIHKMEDAGIVRQLQKIPPAEHEIIADNHPSKMYAQIEKGGRIVATIYESGVMMTPNDVGIPGDLANDGGNLAERRLQQMLEALGGTVQYKKQTVAPQSKVSAGNLFLAQLGSR